jgi:hypothetical protein
LSCVYLCSHLPCTFDGWVPVLDFYIQGFSTSCLLAVQLGSLTSFPSDPALGENSKNYSPAKKILKYSEADCFKFQHQPMSFGCCPRKCHILLNYFGSCNSLVAWVRSFLEFATTRTTFVNYLVRMRPSHRDWTLLWSYLQLDTNGLLMHAPGSTDFSCMYLDQFLSCAYRLRITIPSLWWSVLLQIPFQQPKLIIMCEMLGQNHFAEPKGACCDFSSSNFLL